MHSLNLNLGCYYNEWILRLDCFTIELFCFLISSEKGVNKSSQETFERQELWGHLPYQLLKHAL
jgi:hypothetical protein